MAAFPRPEAVKLFRPPVSVREFLVAAAIAVFVGMYCFFSFRIARSLSGKSDAQDDGTAIVLGRTGVVLLMLVLAVVIGIVGKPRHIDPTSLFIYAAA